VSFLENRIPPPIVLLLTLFVMFVLARFDTERAMQLAPPIINKIIALIWVISGSSVAMLGIREFKHAHTTVNPLQPRRASTLVRSGVFVISRNPMYLGMLLLTIGASSYLASLWSLFGVLFFFVYISRFQIIPEERAMRDLFGDDFNRYCLHTRRWL